MVLQVLADSGEVHHNGDAQGLEDLGVTDTAELEDLRALDGAGGEDGLLPDIDGVRLPAMRELDPGRDSLLALLLCENARNVRLSQHGQVRAAERGVEVALHSAKRVSLVLSRGCSVHSPLLRCCEFLSYCRRCSGT